MILKTYDKGGCVGCPPGMGCLGSMCPQCWELSMTCDCCGEEVEKLYVFEGEQLCADCVLNAVPCITSEDADKYAEVSE